MALVLDLQRSRGSRIVDARTGRRYLDLYTFFASAPLGLNPSGIVDDPAFMTELAQAAANKPANPDVYTTAVRRVRRDVRPGGRRPGAAAPVLHRGRCPGGGERAQDRLRLEEPPERGGRPVARAGHQDHAPDPGVPRPQRLHHVADQHRADQDRPVPEVRLAADRRAGDHLPARRPPRPRSRRPRIWPVHKRDRRSRHTRTTSPRSSPSRSRARVATTTSGPSSSSGWPGWFMITTRC